MSVLCLLHWWQASTSWKINIFNERCDLGLEPDIFILQANSPTTVLLTVNDKLVNISIHFYIQMLKSVWKTNCVFFYVKNTSENSPALNLSETDSGPVESESSQIGATKSDLEPSVSTTDTQHASAILWQGYKKNNDVFLHWQHREKCPEVIKTYNNRCANLILCNTCMIIIYNNIIQN
jgi:hypothetical protein